MLILIKFFNKLFLFFIIMSLTYVNAATLSTGQNRILVTLSGEIVPGDAERLAKIYISDINNIPNGLILDSPGGDIIESIRIANLVKALHISVYTKIPAHGVCASSCFLIYSAAQDRNAYGIDRIRIQGKENSMSPLGIHRPYFPNPNDGPSGIRRQEQIMLEMGGYLTKSGVSNFLIDKMMSHASNDIYWLTERDVQSMGKYSSGYEEQLISKCNYNSQRDDNLTLREFMISNQDGVHRCINYYWAKTYAPLKRQAVERMQKGWRPWK